MDELMLLRPFWLILSVPAIWLFLAQWSSASRRTDWHRHIDSALRDHVLEDPVGSTSRWPLLAGLIAWLVAIVVLAGPVWEKQTVPAVQANSAQVMALDVSRSMDSDDQKPSRMVRAKFKLQDMLEQAEGVETALLVFSEVAYTVSPLTNDVATLEAFLPAIDTSVVPVQGSRLAPAIEKAVALMQQADRTQGSIVLITDAAVPASDINAAQSARADGFSVSVLAMATEEGSPIRLADGSLLQDDSGRIAIARLDANGLADVANAGGGVYVPLSIDNSDIQRIAATGNGRASRGDEFQQTDTVEAEFIIWVERLPWLLVPLTLISLLIFRRGVFA